MSKLTKLQFKAHQQACEMLEQDALSYEEKVFVLENWREDSTHVNSSAGAFIIPQMSCPFKYSGHPYYQRQEIDRVAKFQEKTRIELGASCGIDTSFARDKWHGVAPVVEIVTCEFDHNFKGSMGDLFD